MNIIIYAKNITYLHGSTRASIESDAACLESSRAPSSPASAHAWDNSNNRDMYDRCDAAGLEPAARAVGPDNKVATRTRAEATRPLLGRPMIRLDVA